MYEPASVWSEEVYRGFKEEIQNSVKMEGRKGETYTPLVVVRKPEEDFKPERYPCISLYVTGDDFAPDRYRQVPIRKTLDIERKSALMKKPAVPFDLKLQMDFWTVYQSDMDTMTRIWMSKHFRQFNLITVDDKNGEVNCNCLRKGSIVSSDLMQEGKRLFHKILSYVIWVEINEENLYNTSVVTDINIKVDNNY